MGRAAHIVMLGLVTIALILAGGAARMHSGFNSTASMPETDLFAGTVTSLSAGEARLSTPDAATNFRVISPEGVDIMLVTFAPE